MNSRLLRTTLLNVACLALVAGCAAQTETMSYYSLHVPHASGTAHAPDAVAISIGSVTLPDVLKQTRIATGGENGQYRLAEYHRWTGEVEGDMARALAERLSQALGTENVFLFPWDQHAAPEFRVLVDVLILGGKLGQEAVLSVRWTLVDVAGKSAPFVQRTDIREALPDAEHASWVAAQQRNVAQLADDIAASIAMLRN